MRFRSWICGTLTLLACAALPVRADDAKSGVPTVAVRVKSLDGLLEDAKYIATLAGKEEEAKQLDGVIQAVAGPQGLAGTGLDTKRPIGLYGMVTPAGVDSYVVLLIPVADEKAFVEKVKALVGGFGVKIDKGNDDVYTVTIPNSPVEGYFAVADRYAYITARDKEPLAPARRLAPAKLFTDDANALAAVTVRIDQIPDMIKQIALGQMEVQMAAAKDRKEPNETPAQAKFKSETVDYVAQQIKTLFSDGQAFDARLTIDRKTDDFAFQVSLTGKPGSALANDIAALGQRASRFGVTGDLAFRFGLNLAVPPALRDSFAAVMDEGIAKGIEKEQDAGKKELLRKAFTAFGPTLKAGRLDVFAGLQGPDSQKHYTLVGGVRLQDSQKIERMIKEDVIPQMPEKERGRIKLDAEKVGGVSAHRVDVSKDMDAQGRKMFGENASMLVAFPKEAAVFALGADPAAALRAVAESREGRSAPPFVIEASIARVAPLDKDKGEVAAKAAQEVFGANPRGADQVRVSLEGGPALRLRASFKGKIITFGSKMEGK